MKVPDTSERSLFKIISSLKRVTDKWVTSNLQSLTSSDFNVTFMPYFMHIGYSGISNHELVSKIKVSKQGVSKNVKELERQNLVFTTKGENDARSMMIFLTPSGIELFESIRKKANEISAEYIKLLGQKKYDQMLDSLIKIKDFHESLEEEDAGTSK